MSRRNFNSRQRIALFIRAQGRCPECNEPLAPSFHADHVLPFSKGGATEMQNGQALCPPCNLKKSDKIQATSKDTDFFVQVEFAAPALLPTKPRG